MWAFRFSSVEQYWVTHWPPPSSYSAVRNIGNRWMPEE